MSLKDYKLHIDFDGLIGELTREEWLEDPIIQEFDRESQEKILNALNHCSNVEFFAESETEALQTIVFAIAESSRPNMINTIMEYSGDEYESIEDVIE